MPDVVHTLRLFPDGSREECRLAGGAGRYRLAVRSGAGAVEREVPAADLAAALARCPEIVDLTARDALQIHCDSAATRQVLLGQLVDTEPDRDTGGDTSDGQDADDIEPAFADLLRWRALTIDGVPHRPLAVDGPTRIARVVGGVIEPDQELIRASWYGESAVDDSGGAGSEGADVLGLIGGDLLIGYSRGDLPHAEITPVDAGDLPLRIADWLAADLHAAAFLVQVSRTPGLDATEADELTSNVGRTVTSRMSDDLTRRVVGALRETPAYRDLHNALLHVESVAGHALYGRLRGVLTGDEDILHLLAEHV